MFAIPTAIDPTASELSHATTAAFFDIARDEVFRLETKRMWLRWPHHTDAANIASWAGLAEVADMTATWPIDVTDTNVRQRIATARAENSSGTAMRFVMVNKDQPTYAMGQIGIVGHANGTGHVGYHLDPACNGLGLMTEALTRVVEIAGHVSGLTQLDAGVRLINPASRRVLEKCGFVHVGQGISTSAFRGDMPVDQFEHLLPQRRRLAWAA
jgi:RimJ/RimL family protein N-acetyltransferase